MCRIQSSGISSNGDRRLVDESTAQRTAYRAGASVRGCRCPSRARARCCQSPPQARHNGCHGCRHVRRAGARLQPQPWTPAPPGTAALHQRRMHRDALGDARTQCRHQRHALEHQPVILERVRARRTEVSATRTAQIAVVEPAIQMALAPDEAWATAAASLASITGRGTRPSAWLLTATRTVARTPSPEAAAKDVGWVPHVHQSGTSVRGRARIGHRGHARLRRALDRATLRAIQQNPPIKACYQRWRAKGKPQKWRSVQPHATWYASLGREQPHTNPSIQPMRCRESHGQPEGQRRS